MGTPHNEAPRGAFAKTVLMPGDPLRAKFIAETFLEDAALVNNVRGIQGWTGTYQGTRVSVMASGMGMPSIGIYSHELFHFYDVDNIIRVGSAGAISPRLKLRDVVFGQGSCTDSNYAHQFGLGGTFAPIADFTLLETAVAVARKLGIEPHVGPNVKIKAAGGIADLKDAEDFIALGASRLGTSRIVKAVKAMEQQ